MERLNTDRNLCGRWQEFESERPASGTGYAGRDDLLLAAFGAETAVAGVLTTSRTAAAPVRWNRARLEAGGVARWLVVNAGNANCFTGEAGVQVVEKTAARAAALLDCAPEEVCIASTGKIGVLPDPAKLQAAVADAHGSLSGDDWQAAAAAIMTTDTFPKAASASPSIGDTTVTLQGVTKGSTMIAPSMATTLSFVFTDARLPAAVLQSALSEAADATYNAMSVDNTQSTNDMILIFATAAGPEHAPIVDPLAPELIDFRAALRALLAALAQEILQDAGQDGTVIRVTVSGAESEASARRIGRAVVDSYLIRRMVARGGDFAMGRVIAAVGMAGEPVNQAGLLLTLGSETRTRNGAFIAEAIVDVDEIRKNGLLEFGVDVGVGGSAAISYAVAHGDFI